MSRNEYFHVFESLFYALVIAEILIGWNKMIASRKTIKVYWAHLAFTIIYFFRILATYSWEFYRTPFDLVDSVLTFFLFVAIKPAGYYFAAYQAFPKHHDGVDFKEYFASRKKEILLPAAILQFFVAIMTASEVANAKGWNYVFSTYALSGQALGEVWLQSAFIPAILFAAYHKRLWSSEVLAILGILAQSYYTVVKYKGF